MKTIRRLPPLEVLDHLFDYNPRTGELLWRVKTSQRTNIGDVAGYINKKDNQRMICVHSTYYSATRVAWCLFYKEDPYGKKICHKDGNPLNNSIDNLECI